jgi:two-component system, NarL family, sensor histidine kinase DegS
VSGTSEGIAVGNLLETEMQWATEAIPRLENDLREVEEEISKLAVIRRHVARNPEGYAPHEREDIFERSERLAARRSELQTWLKAAVERMALVQAVSESMTAQLQDAYDRAAAAIPAPAATPVGTRPPSVLEIHEAVEAERLRIARDLHDGPAQVLSNLVLEADILERLLKRDPALVAAEIQDFRNSVTNAVADVRRFMFDLRPDSLDDLGLIATMRRFTSEWQQRAGVTCHLNLTGDERRLPAKLEEVLYRIVVEALSNVRRHAEAKVVEVALDIRPDRVRIRVKDDGRGFDPSEPAPKEGPRRLGIVGMQERAASVGGLLTVRSQPGTGTEVEGEFPLAAG